VLVSLLIALGIAVRAPSPSHVYVVQAVVVQGIRSDALGRALDAELRAMEGAVRNL
jgi:hypothetical protein